MLLPRHTDPHTGYCTSCLGLLELSVMSFLGLLELGQLKQGLCMLGQCAMVAHTQMSEQAVRTSYQRGRSWFWRQDDCSTDTQFGVANLCHLESLCCVLDQGA